MAESSNREEGNNDVVMMEDKHEHIIPKVFPPIPLDNDDNDDDDKKQSKGDTITTLEGYRTAHAESIRDIDKFWSKEAMERLHWFVSPFAGSTIPTTITTGHTSVGRVETTNQQRVCYGNFDAGDVSWFPNGKLNVCYNAIDRHLLTKNNDNNNDNNNNKIAMIWEGDEPNEIRTITYEELLRNVCQIANALKSVHVTKGDVVTIYMPMIPELPMTMLACTRIGAIHSVVFAGFSSEALSQRVSAAKSKVIVTADVGKRGGKVIFLKDIVNECRTKHNVEEIIEHVLVFERFYHPKKDGTPHEIGFCRSESAMSTSSSSSSEEPTTYEMKPKDIRMDVLVAGQRPYCVPEWMDSEDPLFILYTSGSTGKPKGLVHTTAGYALFASFTTQTTFGIGTNNNTTNEIFACVADCGWITGHTYVVYGPLLNGCTTFVFESTPVYPTAGRYWDMIERHKITHFYTAPTAIRLLMKFGDEIPKKYNVSTIKVLGTVGEPINPEAWRWYYEVIGRGKCTVADTYWQTETGGHIITNLPGITPMKPGSCTLPMFGIDPVVLDPMTGEEVTTPDEHGNYSGVLAIKQPWPGMARTCLGDHHRYMETYLQVYQGYYYTGDSVIRDSEGYHFIVGRVDDVLNVSGHRIGTAEVESALVAHAAIAQAAVVGQPHEIKGTSIAAFVMLIDGHENDNEKELINELRQLVRMDIGGFAAPDMIIVAPSLPMTRSGKIMRRILRKIVCHEVDSLGDTSTLADPSIVEILIQKVAAHQ